MLRGEEKFHPPYTHMCVYACKKLVRLPNLEQHRWNEKSIFWSGNEHDKTDLWKLIMWTDSNCHLVCHAMSFQYFAYFSFLFILFFTTTERGRMMKSFTFIVVIIIRDSLLLASLSSPDIIRNCVCLYTLRRERASLPRLNVIKILSWKVSRVHFFSRDD